MSIVPDFSSPAVAAEPAITQKAMTMMGPTNE